MDQLASRLCRSKSWVSRRLGLLDALDGSAQDRVRAGMVPAHAAMKYLVPLARANQMHCKQLVAGLGDTQVSVRELGAPYMAWKRADRAGKRQIVAEPLLVLRALAAMAEEPEDEVALLHKDLTMLRPEQTNIFFKLMEERYRQRATIITTNLDNSEWANFLGNKALVGALLSRLRHQCHTVKIDGPSLRGGDGDSTT